MLDHVKKLLVVCHCFLLNSGLLAFAAEHPHSSQGEHKHSLWDIIVHSDLLNTLILAFAIIYLGNKFLPKMVDERRKQISKELKDAEVARINAENELREARKKTENINAEIEQIKKDGFKNAELIKNEIEKDTKKELEELNQRIKREINASHEEAVQQVKKSTSEAAIKLAEEALVKISSKPDIQKKLQQDFVKDLEVSGKTNRSH